ncbi:Mis12-domain-containing protein, partial [Hymenopellis radicata]
MSEPPAPAKPYQAIPPLLLAEALGFSPQLLLDDIINIANDSIDDGVNGMEAFLEKWVEDRAVDRPGSKNWDGNQEVEQGLVAFQTLLEFHTDMAFDYLEAWSLRNIFAVPFDLPIVLPHQQGLDLTVTPEREQELMDEATELRAKIEEQRTLRRTLTKALRVAEARKAIIDKRLERLQILDTPAIQTYATVPKNLKALFTTVSQLPELDPETPQTLAQLQLADPGKQKWETSKEGYLSWAVEQLLARGEGASEIGEIRSRESDIGTAEQLKQMLKGFELAKGVRKSLGNSSQMDTS